MTTTRCGIPVIDLAGTFSSDVRDCARVARDVHAASRELGLFYVTNHGVPKPLIAAHFAAARSFFALEPAEKHAIDVSRSNFFRGYEAFGTQTIDQAGAEFVFCLDQDRALASRQVLTSPV